LGEGWGQDDSEGDGVEGDPHAVRIKIGMRSRLRVEKMRVFFISNLL
jgi:hypothetical protein